MTWEGGNVRCDRRWQNSSPPVGTLQGLRTSDAVGLRHFGRGAAYGGSAGPGKSENSANAEASLQEVREGTDATCLVCASYAYRYPEVIGGAAGKWAARSSNAGNA